MSAFGTFVTIGELTKWAEVRRWGLRKGTDLVGWLGRNVILPYDIRVAYQRGMLTDAAQRRGHPRRQNDTRVAACRTCATPRSSHRLSYESLGPIRCCPVIPAGPRAAGGDDWATPLTALGSVGPGHRHR